jgi:hypothetical protein
MAYDSKTKERSVLASISKNFVPSVRRLFP